MEKIRTEKLLKHLYEDVFDYFVLQDCEGEKDRYLKKNKVYTSSVLLRYFLRSGIVTLNTIILSLINRNKKKRPAVFFYLDPITYEDLLQGLCKDYTVFISNPFKKKANKNTYPILLTSILNDLIIGYESKDYELIQKAINTLAKTLSMGKIDIVVLNDNIHPINRAFVFVCRELGIKTIEIQHAVYPKEMKLIKGLGADYVFVWGDFFKKMYIEQEIRSKQSIRILGYPFNILDKTLEKKKKLTLYYLAQGFHLQNMSNLDIMIDNAVALKEACQKNNINFKCRLHPNSPKFYFDKILPKVQITPMDESLISAIADGDIFVSFNSTAILQASLNDKYCIQLLNIPVVSDNLYELGVCDEVFVDVESLAIHLKKLSRNPSLLTNPRDKKKNNYVMQPIPDAETKFRMLLNDLG